MFSISPQYPAATVYRSAAITFHALPSLPAPCTTHLRRYLYSVFYGQTILFAAGNVNTKMQNMQIFF